MTFPPVTLPLASHLDRRMDIVRPHGWSPVRGSPAQPIRILQIEILSDAEESALITWLPARRPTVTEQS